MNNTGKIITAVAAGAAAGAILGILFAPDKGSETRRKMGEKGKQLSDNVKEKLQAGKEKYNDLKEEIVKTVKQKAEEFA